MPDDNPPEERGITLYAVFDTDDYEGIEYGVIGQKVHMALDSDGLRLCLTIPKNPL